MGLGRAWKFHIFSCGVERNTCDEDEGVGSIVSSANSINMAQSAISNNLAHDTCV